MAPVPIPTQGDILWQASPERLERSPLVAFVRWLERERGLQFDSYDKLWGWSTDALEEFWGALWDY
ncbi:MAG: hypothetical protein KY443_09700, partial [Actinobacteria bacterium]|nr:hypothetical protein [Actinomycetota bacterium]